MVLKGIWKSAMLLFFFVNSCKYICSSVSNKEDMELEQQLKILNKPPIKTILDEGEIIDCIDIYKQPAFDHPLLKNHKIQLNPTSFPNGLTKSSSEMKKTQIRFMKEACPFGTVPIKRTWKEDLIRTRSLVEQVPGVKVDNNSTNGDLNKIVSVVTRKNGSPYYGAIGTVTIYNLSIASDQSSSTNMWVSSNGGDDHDINFITTGWKISQQLNGDRLIRLFTYWAGGKKTRGCFNTLCPGFVVTNNKFGPNVRLSGSSVRDGELDVLDLTVFQDRPTGHWWLGITFNTVIGYWPKEIFSCLQDGAERVAWGGSTYPGENGIYPPMGNGYKPHVIEDTCYFYEIYFIDANNQTVVPLDNVTEQRDPSDCYGLVYNADYDALMFGGPGGNCAT